MERQELENGNYCEIIYGHDEETAEYVDFYNKKGEVYRDGDKPSQYGYFPDGNVRYEYYKTYDILNRGCEKPSYIEYYEDSNIKAIIYHKNDVIHRCGDRPAYICYKPDGTTDIQLYAINGKFLNNDEVEIRINNKKRLKILEKI